MRLLKHIIRCYLRLCDNARAREALRQCLPPLLHGPRASRLPEGRHPDARVQLHIAASPQLTQLACSACISQWKASRRYASLKEVCMCLAKSSNLS